MAFRDHAVDWAGGRNAAVRGAAARDEALDGRTTPDVVREAERKLQLEAAQRELERFHAGFVVGGGGL